MQIQLLCSSSGAFHSGVSETLLFGLLILKLYCIYTCVSIQVILAVFLGISGRENKSVSFVVIKDVLYNNNNRQDDGNEAAVVNRLSNKHVLINVEIMS